MPDFSLSKWMLLDTEQPGISRGCALRCRLVLRPIRSIQVHPSLVALFAGLILGWQIPDACDNNVPHEASKMAGEKPPHDNMPATLHNFEHGVQGCTLLAVAGAVEDARRDVIQPRPTRLLYLWTAAVLRLTTAQRQESHFFWPASRAGARLNSCQWCIAAGALGIPDF